MSRLIAAHRIHVVLIGLSCVFIVGGLCLGVQSLSIGQVIEALAEGTAGASQNAIILYQIRLPRVILGFLIGATLAACGAVLQGLFRNPLADPTLIGVAAGASAGASFVIVIGSGWLSGYLFSSMSIVAFGAFIGGLCTVMLVYRLATSPQGTSVATMLLAGIAISALAGAANSLLSFFSDDHMLRRISLWQMGGLDMANWHHVGLMSLVVLCLIAWLPRESASLNAILLGESEARHLGIDVERMKRRLIILTALGVGVSVAVSGWIAFVGLIVPHLVRLLIGPEHKNLMIASALFGGLLLVAADTFARLLIAPAELPVGILTALLGAPFFVSLLIQNRRWQA